MQYDRKKHHRRSIRLPDHDYRSPGAYLVTICTHKGKLLFGEVVDDDVVLNEYGQIAHEEWQASEDIRREIELDAFVIMPNHIHGIVWIRETDDDSVVKVHNVGRTAVRPYGRRAPWDPLSPGINRPLQHASTACATPAAHGYGSATTMNISSATMHP